MHTNSVHVYREKVQFKILNCSYTGTGDFKQSNQNVPYNYPEVPADFQG